MGNCFQASYGYQKLRQTFGQGGGRGSRGGGYGTGGGTRSYREPGSTRDRTFRPGRDVDKDYRGGASGPGKPRSRCPICGTPMLKVQINAHIRTSHPKGLSKDKYDRHGNKKEVAAPARAAAADKPKNYDYSRVNRAIAAEEGRQDDEANVEQRRDKWANKNKWSKFKSSLPFSRKKKGRRR